MFVSSSPPVETSSQDVRIATLVYQLAWLVIYFKDFSIMIMMISFLTILHCQFPLIEHLVSIFGICVHDPLYCFDPKKYLYDMHCIFCTSVHDLPDSDLRLWRLRQRPVPDHNHPFSRDNHDSNGRGHW